jgi:DAACS family dicarboxylate/amino acid:cation (Na+ or H+) symporter
MSKLTHTVSWIVIAMVAGVGLALLQPELAVKFSPMSKLVLQLIKAIAAPLVFFAILEALLRFRVRGGDFFKLLTITFTNIIIAISIGLFVKGRS